MPNIPTTTYAAGDTIVAADVNNDFTNVASASTALDDTNTRTEWVSRRHVSASNTPVFNKNFSLVEEAVNTGSVNLTTFQQVLIGAVPFRVTFGTPVVLEPGQVLRAHFDCNVDGTLLPAPPDFELPAPGDADCYQFAFYWFTGGSAVRVGCLSTYSVYDLTDHVSAGANPFNSQITDRQRKRQRVNHTLCYVNTTNANITVDWIEVRARLLNLSWVSLVTLAQGTLTVFTGRY